MIQTIYHFEYSIFIPKTGLAMDAVNASVQRVQSSVGKVDAVPSLSLVKTFWTTAIRYLRG